MIAQGLYQLVSIERTSDAGEPVNDTGGIAHGQTWYGAGRMWVLIAPLGRPVLHGRRPATMDEHEQRLRGVVSYYGTYEVDEQRQTVSHHVEGALDPDWVGRVLVRRYVCSGDLLTLIIARAGVTTETVYRRLAVSDRVG